MRLITGIQMNGQELNELQFPIIVEMWNKVVGNGNCGSKHRSWLVEFTKDERKLISYYHKLFYNWYLVKGTPQKHIFKNISDINLVQRAVNFFATI